MQIVSTINQDLRITGYCYCVIVTQYVNKILHVANGNCFLAEMLIQPDFNTGIFFEEAHYFP
jgi:hypothetical protein